MAAMQTLDDIQKAVQTHPAVLLYFSAPQCTVCRTLRPKVWQAMETHFESLRPIYVDVTETPEISSHYSVFAIPTLVVFLDGREFVRKSRYMSVGDLVEEIRRPYEIMMS